MRLAGTWSKRLFAATLGAVIVGAPLFTVHADEGAFDRHGEHRYDVRRGEYEKPGGSDTEVAPGKYADEEKAKEQRGQHQGEHRAEHRDGGNREQRGETEAERRERHERREEHERQRREQVEREEGRSEEQDGPRQYKYDVRRGMYEQEGGSDTEVSRGMYEQPSEDGERRGLKR